MAPSLNAKNKGKGPGAKPTAVTKDAKGSNGPLHTDMAPQKSKDVTSSQRGILARKIPGKGLLKAIRSFCLNDWHDQRTLRGEKAHMLKFQGHKLQGAKNKRILTTTRHHGQVRPPNFESGCGQCLYAQPRNRGRAKRRAGSDRLRVCRGLDFFHKTDGEQLLVVRSQDGKYPVACDAMC